MSLSKSGPSSASIFTLRRAIAILYFAHVLPALRKLHLPHSQNLQMMTSHFTTPLCAIFAFCQGITYNTSYSGHYLYLEASDSQRNKGDDAILVSPTINSNGPLCMTFYYHMYGSGIGTLQVVSNQTAVWKLSGDQGNRWYKATVPLRSSSGAFQVCCFE